MITVILRFIISLFCIASIQADQFELFFEQLHSTTDSLVKLKSIDSFMIVNTIFPLTNDTTCYFLFRGKSDRIIVTGDHTQWSQKGDTMKRIPGTDLHMVKKVFPADARLDYKLINGTNWILDPRNPLTCAGGFGPNSELRMPRYPQHPELNNTVNIPRGVIFDTTFTSIALNNSRSVKVYLPPNYSPTKQYPVILFHDGIDYVNLAKTPSIIDYLIEQHQIQPLIGVFVSAVNRNAEYAGNQMQQFSEFIVNDILGWIDKRYATSTNPMNRAVAGASNGGNIALYCAAQFPQVFGNVAAQSSNVIASIATKYDCSPALPLRIYCDIGSYDIPVLIPLVKNFSSILQKRAYDYGYTEIPEGHSWGNWKAHIDDYLIRFFPALPQAIEEKSRNTSLIQQVHYSVDTGHITVHFDTNSDHQAMSITLMDITGKVLSETYLNARPAGKQIEILTLQKQVLSAGQYFLQWRTQSSMYTELIIIK